MKSIFKNLKSHWLTVVAATLLLPSAGNSQSEFTWNSPTSGTWSDAANWSPASLPSAGSVLRFGNLLAPGYGASNDLTPASFRSFEFQAAVGTFTGLSPGVLTGASITGGTVKLTGAGAGIRQSGGGAAGISFIDLQMAAAVTLDGDGAGTLAIYSPLSGPGLLMLDRAPDAQTLLFGTSTYTGGTILASGQLGLANSGALGTGPVTFTGGKLRMHVFVSPSGLMLPNPLISTTEPVRFVGNNSGILAGVISGPGGIFNEAAAGISARLTAANTYTGPTVSASTPSTTGNNVVSFEANGTSLSTSAVVANGFTSINLDNSSVNLTNRLPDTVPIRLHRATLSFVGNDAAPSGETLGPIAFDGYTTISIAAAVGSSSTLQIASLNRQDKGVIFARGLALGVNPPATPNTATLLIGSPLTGDLIGGSGPASSTIQSILPWAVGRGANTGNADTLVTFDPIQGLRVLLASEFATSVVDGSTSFENLRLTSAATFTLGTTVNSVVLAGGSLDGTGSLTLTSGALLVASGVTNINLPLHFGGAEAVITTQGNTTINTTIDGTGGLVKAGNSNLIFTVAPFISGILTINAGAVQAASDAQLGGFDSIHINGGRLQFDNLVPESTNRFITLGAAGGTLTVNSPTGSLELLQGLSGVGALVKQGSGLLTLTQPSTHTGSVVINGGVLSISDLSQLGLGKTIVMPSGPTLRLTSPMEIDRDLLITGGSGSVNLDVQADVVWSGPIQHTGVATNAFSLNKIGAGLLTLTSQQSTQNGVFTVASGGLRIDGYLPSANTSSVGLVINANASLSGKGRIERTVGLAGTDPANPAHLIPGGSEWPVGKVSLTFDSSLELGIFSHHRSRIGFNGFASTRIARLNPVPDNSVRFVVELEPGFTPAPGSEFKLLEIGELPLTGDLDWTDNLDLPSGVIWDTSRFSSEGILAVSGTPEAPQITVQPLPQVVAPGGNILLSAAASGSDPLLFQWFKDGQPLPSATGTQLHVIGATLADAGDYRVEVTSPFGHAVSHNAAVAVSQSPLFAMPLADRTVIKGDPVAITAKFGGESPILVEWFRGTILVLSETVASGTSTLSLPAITAPDAGTYTVQLSNTFGNLSAQFELGVVEPVEVVSDPAGATGNLGDQVSFSVTATGTGPLSYQWQHRPDSLIAFADLPGATGSTLQMVVGQTTQGEYRVRVSNAANSAFSAPALLSALLPGNGHFIGQWTGVFDRHATFNSNLGGRFDLNANGRGSYSGSIQLGTQTVKFRGALADPANPIVSFQIPRKNAAPLTFSFVLLGTEHRLRSITLTDGTHSIQGSGWRNPWTKTNPATAFAGYYTLSLDWADPTLYDSPSNDAVLPQGTGLATFTVATTTGRLSIRGVHQDGTPFTVSTFCGSQGSIPVFHLTRVVKQVGSCKGALAILAQPNNLDNTLTGALDWNRPASADRLYSNGWSELDLTASGGRYTPPAPGERSFDLTLSAGGIDAAEPVSGTQRVVVSAKNKATFAPPNERQLTMTLNPKTGLFSGTAQLIQEVIIPPITNPVRVPRRVSYRGIRVGADGVGHFNLPQLPAAPGENAKRNTPILSGAVELVPVP